MAIDPKICKKIINYLSLQNNQQDNLNGILLGVFEAQYQDLNDRILKNLGELITLGAIVESFDEQNNSYYKVAIQPFNGNGDRDVIAMAFNYGVFKNPHKCSLTI